MDNWDIYNLSLRAHASAAETLVSELVTRTLTEFSSSNYKSIGQYAFAKCEELVSVELPECIRLNNYAFQSCSALVNVVIPKVEYVGYGAFSSCTALEMVDIPKAANINGSAFASCSSLTALIISSGQRCVLINANALTDTPIALGTGYIYVPDNLVSSYKTAANWSTYSAQIKGLSELEV